MPRIASLLACAAAGCVASASPGDGLSVSEAPAPLVGVDGSEDGADRNCHVVLRELQRPWMGGSWETTGSSWVWSGTIEISEAAAAEGLTPALLYQSGSDPTWREVAAMPLDAPATPGFVRYAVRIHEGLPGPGMSGTALARSRIEVVPFLRMPEGGRLFDHNRNPGDTDNYVLTAPDLSVWRNDAVCAPPAGPQRARLVFEADWSERREGVLAPGGEVSIVYAPARLAQCRKTQGNYQLWDITAHVVFEPGNQRHAVSVRDGQVTMSVPIDARRATLWFEATSTSGCHAWDSNLGANYSFDAATPPQWVGNGTYRFTRATDGDPCTGLGSGDLRQGFTFDTWTRTRAALTNLCFEVYEPGLTDRDDPDLWQKLDVSLRYRHAGQTTWQSQPVAFDRRVGNNARYALSVRGIDPFRPYQCPTAMWTTTPDGAYDQTTLEYYMVVNGHELRPQPGGAFVGTFVDYAGTHDCE